MGLRVVILGIVNPSMLTAAKSSITILKIYLPSQIYVDEILEGEMVIRTLPTTLLQMF